MAPSEKYLFLRKFLFYFYFCRNLGSNYFRRGLLLIRLKVRLVDKLFLYRFTNYSLNFQKNYFRFQKQDKTIEKFPSARQLPISEQFILYQSNYNSLLFSFSARSIWWNWPHGISLRKCPLISMPKFRHLFICPIACHLASHKKVGVPNYSLLMTAYWHLNFWPPSLCLGKEKF